MQSNTENVFNDKLTGTNLSRGYVKPLITGMEEVFAAGPQIGEPVVGISLDIIDGAEHRFEAKARFKITGPNLLLLYLWPWSSLGEV